MIRNAFKMAIAPLYKQSTSRSKDNLNNCFHRLDSSLLQHHPSVSSTTNPVLKNLNRKKSDGTKHIRNVLEQYCFLPAEIINLLDISRDKLSAWPSVRDELTRNIDEERGSRTAGISHYEILASALHEEAGLNITHTQREAITAKFFTNLKFALISSQEAYVAGMTYGLENAAVPELTVVAQLINYFALSSGHGNPLIKIPPSRIANKSVVKNYDLDTFFRMHLLDFEVGHKNGLAMAIRKQHAQLEINLPEFEAGFEFTLNLMDTWWEDLATL